MNVGVLAFLNTVVLFPLGKQAHVELLGHMVDPSHHVLRYNAHPHQQGARGSERRVRLRPEQAHRHPSLRWRRDSRRALRSPPRPALDGRTAVPLTPTERTCVRHGVEPLIPRIPYNAHNHPLN